MKYEADVEVKEEGQGVDRVEMHVEEEVEREEVEEEGREEAVLHVIKPKDMKSEEVTEETVNSVKIQPDVDTLLNLLVGDVLADDAVQTIMTKPGATPREASQDEKYARTISLLEKTAETQRLTAMREQSLAEREANLMGFEKTIKNLLSQPLGATQKLMVPGSPLKGSNPNSGSIQLQSSSGDSMKLIAARLGQGKSAPPTHRGSRNSGKFQTVVKSKPKVDWSAVNLAPGASFEAELNQSSVPVDFGTDKEARATLIIPGEYNPDKFQELKNKMEGEVAEGLELKRKSVVVEDIRKGSILFDVLIVGDGVEFSAREKMRSLHEACSAPGSAQMGGLLGRVVGIKDEVGKGIGPHRTNFSRLLRGGESFMNLPIKNTIIDPSQLMEVGVGGWQIKKDWHAGRRRRSFEAFEEEHEGRVERELGSGSEMPQAKDEVGRGSVDLSMVLEGCEGGDEEGEGEEGGGAEEGKEIDGYLEVQKSKPILNVTRRKSTRSFDGGNAVVTDKEEAKLVEEPPAAKVAEVAEPAPITQLPKRQKFDTNFGRFLKAGNNFVKEKLSPQKQREIALGKAEQSKIAGGNVEVVGGVGGGIEGKKDEGGSGSGRPESGALEKKKQTEEAEEERRGQQTKVLVEGAIVKERDVARRKVQEMERQLEETKRRLQDAEVLLKKQQKSMSKPPKLISVAAEFPDADYR